MSNAAEVFVLANQSAERASVRWYHAKDTAEDLFDSAVASGSDGGKVVLFALQVPDVANQSDVLQRAEAAVSAGQFSALRTYPPAR